MPYKRKKKSYRRKPTRRVYHRRSRFRSTKKVASGGKVVGAPEILCATRRVPIAQRPMRWGTSAGDVPRMTKVKSSYNDAYMAWNPATPIASYSFPVNSWWRPNPVAAQKRPTLYLAMQSLYENYKVTNAMLKVTVHNLAEGRMFIGLLATDTLPVIGNYTDDELRRSCNVSTVIDSTLKENETASISMFIPFTKLVGKLSDVSYKAAFAANPAELIYCTLFAFIMGSAVNVLAQLSLEITQWVECTEPISDRTTEE